MSSTSDSPSEPVSEPVRASSELRDREETLTACVVDALVQARAAKGALEALEITTLATAAALVQEQMSRADRRSSESAIAERVMVAELAVATRSHERTMRRQMSDAADLCARFAGTVSALREGRISRGHVAVVHEAGFDIEDDDARGEYERIALARAETMTAGRLRPIVQVVAARVNPRSIDERHAVARRRRAVWVTDLADGMAELRATGSAVLIRGVHDRLTQLADAIIAARAGTENSDSAAADGVEAEDERGAIPHEPDTRSIDEVRADILADLLLTGTAQTCVAGDSLSAIRATVHITVPVLTAAGTGAEPAVLAGHGPIDAETARQLAGGADGWERVMTSPVTGGVLAVDRYRPGTDLKRFLRARDEHCRFPGCRMPVTRCDIDHTRDAALGGSTSESNLAHLCRGHHIVKHASEWRVRQSGGGVLTWTSPTGRAVVDEPPPTLRFVPEPDPPLHARWRTAAPDDPSWRFVPDGDPPPF